MKISDVSKIANYTFEKYTHFSLQYIFQLYLVVKCLEMCNGMFAEWVEFELRRLQRILVKFILDMLPLRPHVNFVFIKLTQNVLVD
jgi:hypothetical protein